MTRWNFYLKAKICYEGKFYTLDKKSKTRGFICQMLSFVASFVIISTIIPQSFKSGWKEILTLGIMFVACVALSELVRVLVLPKDIKSHADEILYDFNKVKNKKRKGTEQ